MVYLNEIDGFLPGEEQDRDEANALDRHRHSRGGGGNLLFHRREVAAADSGRRARLWMDYLCHRIRQSANRASSTTCAGLYSPCATCRRRAVRTGILRPGLPGAAAPEKRD